MTIRIRAVAGLATLQDDGRRGHRQNGVPPSGAFDRESYELASALVGAPSLAAIEVAFGPIEFEVEGSGSLAFVGADAYVTVNELQFQGQLRLQVAAGDVVRVEPNSGARVYVATPGGFVAATTLGSASGATVAVGDVLVCGASRRLAPLELGSTPGSVGATELRAVLGPQAPGFDLDLLQASPWTVTHHLDRVGVRLSGSSLGKGTEMTSEPSVFGAVQIAGDGTPILIGPDGPTIGGYPKVAVVCRADLDRIGQLSPGQVIRLRIVDPSAAAAAWRERVARISELAQAIAQWDGG